MGVGNSELNIEPMHPFWYGRMVSNFMKEEFEKDPSLIVDAFERYKQGLVEAGWADRVRDYMLENPKGDFIPHIKSATSLMRYEFPKLVEQVELFEETGRVDPIIAASAMGHLESVCVRLERLMGPN